MAPGASAVDASPDDDGCSAKSSPCPSGVGYSSARVKTGSSPEGSEATAETQYASARNTALSRREDRGTSSGAKPPTPGASSRCPDRPSQTCSGPPCSRRRPRSRSCSRSCSCSRPPDRLSCPCGAPLGTATQETPEGGYLGDACRKRTRRPSGAGVARSEGHWKLGNVAGCPRALQLRDPRGGGTGCSVA